MLTHSNFVELSRNARRRDERGRRTRESSTLLFITTAHIFARFISVLASHGGVKVGHQADTKQLLPSLGSFKPTFLLAVPRVFEKVYNSAEQKAEAGGKGKIFRGAADVAIAHSKALDAGHVPLGLKLQFALFDRLVYSKLRAAMGGRVGTPSRVRRRSGLRLGHFFRSLGVKILEGYGLTETTAPATVNLADEVQDRHGRPAASRRRHADRRRRRDLGQGRQRVRRLLAQRRRPPQETFDGEWFKTGDIGALDDDGFLSITGRKKEIIVTAGGKNVAPAALEDPIRANPMIGQVIVVGDQKPFIAALDHARPEMLPAWLNNNGDDADVTLARRRETRGARRGAAGRRRRQRAVSRAESIRKFGILPTEFTEASGHLTPKMSIKRNIIVEDFADEIEGIYSGHSATEGVSMPAVARSSAGGASARPCRLTDRRRPVRAPRPTRGSACIASRLTLGLEPLDVEVAVEVVGLVLQRLRHAAVALEFDRVAVEVDAGDRARAGSARRGKQNPGTDRQPSSTSSGSPETSTSTGLMT